MIRQTCSSDGRSKIFIWDNYGVGRQRMRYERKDRNKERVIEEGRKEGKKERKKNSLKLQTAAN
jgi:hypothetical protein